MFRITKIEEKDLPKVKQYYCSLKAEFEGFMSMNIKVAKVDTGDHYKNSQVAAQVLGKAAKVHGYPIIVAKRKDEIYFIRRDM